MIKKMILCLSATVVCLQIPLVAQEDSGQTRNLQSNFTSIAQNAIPAVVSVKVKKAAPKKKDEQFQFQDPSNPLQDEFFRQFFGIPRREERQRPPAQGQASGFFVSEDGYILTNNHVVAGGGEVTIQTKEGREYKAEVIGTDENTDVAVLKVEATNLPYLELGDSTALQVGEWAVAIGNPLGLQATLTVGVVSATGRSGLSLANIEDFIQTDAAINRGNSGGPLLDLDGKVIGINTAIVTSNMGGGSMGIGFAVPSNMARYVMEQLIDTGMVTRGFLGVTLQQIDHDLSLAFGLSKVEGALVTDTAKDSPAETAGIKQGDIILQYNGKRVSTIASLRNAVALLEPGTDIKLLVLRDGKEIEVPIKIGTFPESGMLASSKDNKLGVIVTKLSPELSRTLGLINEKGVVVQEVTPNSAAFLAGIRKGALIVSVNQRSVTTPEEFFDAVGDTPEGRGVLLLVKQGDVTRFLSIPLS